MCLRGFMVLGFLSLGASAGAQGVCVHPEHWHLLPEESRKALEVRAAMASERGALTPIPVAIDPLGAEGTVPWLVHITALNVRNQPTTSGSLRRSKPSMVPRC